MKIVTVTGYKGGIGKSTTAIHLATFLADYGKTFLVDGDPNRTALNWAERSQGEGLPFEVTDQRQAMRVISGADFIVIDTPARPDSDDLKELSKGCDLLILPTPPDIISLEPMLQTAQVLGESNYKALLTIVPPKPNREGELMQTDLREAGVPVFTTMIRRTVGYSKAALQGKAIRDLDEQRVRIAWEDYQALGQELLTELQISPALPHPTAGSQKQKTSGAQTPQRSEAKAQSKTKK